MATIRLTLLGGERAGEAITFDGDRLVIGRATSCELTISDASVSRQHAAIERRGLVFELIDLGSHNGTFVAGRKERVSRRILVNGDEI
ncbi:MAG TPA: FHA domain-containing protein, partial [Candidatus Binatia bacterium]|nr:FHA domain-containing protein [Candidatus Binatia bacterium]